MRRSTVLAIAGGGVVVGALVVELGDGEAASGAMKKPLADLGFEVGDLPADRRLRDAQ